MLFFFRSPERFPGALPRLVPRAAWRPLGSSSIRRRCPPAEQRAPFVCGCTPKDIDPSHDTGRVRTLQQSGFDDGQALDQPTGGFFFDSRRPVPSAPFSFQPETTFDEHPAAELLNRRRTKCILNPTRPHQRCSTAASAAVKAATLAWQPLGLEPAWFAEIDPFPCALFTHHYPDVPNLGDMTRIAEQAFPPPTSSSVEPLTKLSTSSVRVAPRQAFAVTFA